MARLDDNVHAALLLTSPLAGEGPPPLKAREFWALVDEVGDLTPLLAEVPADRPDAERLRALLGRATAFAFAVEDAERQGITLLSALDARYPARLRSGMGAQAPPVLHTVGPLGLLAGPLVAVVAADDLGQSPSTGGSGEAAEASHLGEGGEIAGGEEVSRVRGASERSTLVAARAAAAAAAADGHTVLTGGFATPLDAAATSAALEAGGAVVGLLSHPLSSHLHTPEVRRAVHGGRLCLVTPFRPNAPWTPTAEAGRAAVAAALADRTVTVPTRTPTLLDDIPPDGVPP